MLPYSLKQPMQFFPRVRTPARRQNETIEVPALARVEGEGGLYIGLENGKAVEIRLDIYEPPRFLKAFCTDVFYRKSPISQRASAAFVPSLIK